MPPKPYFPKSAARKAQATSGAKVLEEARAQVARASFNRQDPIKQYVRRTGWEQVIREYLAKRTASGVTEEWKYFTMPGAYASDIGLLWSEGLLSVSAGVLNVAICDRENAEGVAARLAPIGQPLAITNKDLNEAFRDANNPVSRHFPYDVINLDLCNQLLQPKSRDNLEALDWIFRRQQGQGFLLLLTARVDKEIEDLLREQVEANINDEPMFREAYEARFGSTDLKPCMSDYPVFYQIAVPKLVAKWAKDKGYQVHERFVARYARDGFHMICNSFEFEPIGPRKESKKFTPRPSFLSPMLKAPIGVNDKLYERLSSAVQRDAIERYVEFVSSLPSRNVTDVVRLLNGDSARRTNLTKDAEQFDEFRWLEANKN